MITLQFPCQQRRTLVFGLTGLSVLLIAPRLGRAQAVVDPLDARATDWRLEDWRALDADERRWAVIGFTLGWHGLPAPDAPAAQLIPQDIVDERLRHANDGAVARPERRVAAVLSAAQLARPLPRPAMSGHDWMALSPRHRLALLHGFYAGSYGRALADLPGVGLDDAAFDGDFANARRLVKPDLALAPSLLFARLSDWYFYTNHRAAPLVRSIETIVRQIRQP